MKEKIGQILIEMGADPFQHDGAIESILALFGGEKVYLTYDGQNWKEARKSLYDCCHEEDRRILYTGPQPQQPDERDARIAELERQLAETSYTKFADAYRELEQANESICTQRDALQALFAEQEASEARTLQSLLLMTQERNDAEARLDAAEFDLNHTRDLLEMAEKDAARYQYIRAAGDVELYLHNYVGIDNCKQIGGEYLDAAINAAIAAGKESHDCHEQD